MRPTQKPCSSCGNTEPEWKTIYPSFEDSVQPHADLLQLKETLQCTYDYKRDLKAKLDLLGGYPYINPEEAEVQRKAILDKMNDIEAYLIDMVIRMYCKK